MTLIQKLADVENPDSLSNRLRSRRFERFRQLVEGLPRPLRIIDFGGTADFWQKRGGLERAGICIVCVNLAEQQTAHTNLRCVQADVTDLRCFADMTFDIAFSNSVIEHLESFDRQKRMADEMRRLAPALWLQTPNYWFPIEPHFHVPGWQWMPAGMRRAMLQRSRCGWRGPCPDPAKADALVREVRLLTKRELAALFPRAEIQAERFGGFVKSWIVTHGFSALHQPVRCAA